MTARRVPALDLLRGVAVAGMIVVNAPGDWAAMYAPLRHAAWNGWTATDMVFPTFLFSAGVALGLSFPRASDDGGAYWRRLARRVAALIALGLALEATYNLAIALGAWFPGEPRLSHLRVPGILQRIALCYGLAGVLARMTARRVGASLELRPGVLAAAVVVLLVGYWAALTFVSFAGAGAGRLDPCGNLAAAIDRAVFTVPHLWPLGWASEGGTPCYDPEGMLSTLPATTNCLLGVLAAQLVRRGAVLRLATIGAALVIGGLLLDPVLPINKRIWTSSFALLSGGVSMLALAALVVVADRRILRMPLAPIRVLGGNAILAFALSTLLGRFYGAPLLHDGTTSLSPATALQHGVVHVVADPYLASLICSLLVLALVVALIAPLHRRGLHLRL